MHLNHLNSRDPALVKAFTVAFLLLICLVFSAVASVNVRAQQDASSDISNAFCLGCHSTAGMSTSLPSGEDLPLGVDEEFFNASIHGQVGIGCTKCHFEHTEYPHPPLPDQITRREYSILINEGCSFCHMDIAEELEGNVHQLSLDAGNLNAAICTDCHGAHDTKSLHELRPMASQTCKHCHLEIYDLYSQSVHGEALLSEGNDDVPNCIDCHEAHHIAGPSNTGFHLFSPDICAECHADRELMGKYDINTDVMDSWVYDFHGKTVTLFQETEPTHQTDKAVCIDCHSVHDIRRPDDPNSTVMKENLLVTCKKCHPAATANFPDSWMGHYNPDLQKYPLVFFVTWFYRLLITGVIGGMLVFVVSDYIRQIIDHKGDRTHG